MHTEKFWGNMIAATSTAFNCIFATISGEQLHLIGGALGLVFTALLNFRRAMRELNQLYLIFFKAKNAKQVEFLLEEKLEKDKDDED
jgi:hypothetical protein